MEGERIMKIIDAHIHLFERITGFGFRGGARPVGQGFVRFDTGDVQQKFPAWLGNTGVTAERMIEFMDEHKIEKAVVMQGPSYGLHNQYYSEVKARYPDRFYPAAMVDPEIYMFDKALRNMIDHLKFRIFKLEMSTIAGLKGAHVRLNTFDAPNMEKLFAEVEKIGGTIALDIGGPDEESYQIDSVVELAKRHPKLKIVMCHLLEPNRDDDENLKKNLEKCKQPNIWFDISSLPTILQEAVPYEMGRRYIKLGKSIVGADRLLWGTDTPGSLVKQDYDTMLKLFVLENDDFTADEKEGIAYYNAFQAYPLNE